MFGRVGGTQNVDKVGDESRPSRELKKESIFKGAVRALSKRMGAPGRSMSSQQRADTTQLQNKYEAEALANVNKKTAKIKRETNIAKHFIELEKLDSDCKFTAMEASPEIHKRIDQLKSQNSTREIQDLNERLSRLNSNNSAERSQTKPVDGTRAKRNDQAIAEICLKITQLGGEVNVNAIPPSARRFLDALVLEEELEKVDAGRTDKPTSENSEAQVAPDTWNEPTFEDLEDQLFGDEPGEQT